MLTIIPKVPTIEPDVVRDVATTGTPRDSSGVGYSGLTSAAKKVTSMAIPHAVLYTRQGCHLCDQAHAELLRFGLTPDIIDIDEDPELTKRYTDCVPVVWIGGRERFRGRVNPILLQRLLHSP